MLSMTKKEYNPEYRGEKVIGYCKYDEKKNKVTRYTLNKPDRLPLYEYKPTYNPETQYSELTGYAKIDDFFLLVWVKHDYNIATEEIE